MDSLRGAYYIYWLILLRKRGNMARIKIKNPQGGWQNLPIVGLTGLQIADLGAKMIDKTSIVIDATMVNRLIGCTASTDVTIDLTAMTTGQILSVVNVAHRKNITFSGKVIVGDSSLNGDKGSAASILIYEGEAYITTSEKA